LRTSASGGHYFFVPTRKFEAPPVNRRLLIVDDNEDDARLFGRILENAGYLVSNALSGKEGLRAIREEAFELVILDLAIPDIDGFEILRAIRNQVPKPKIIAVSGVIRANMLEAARMCGADLVLDKLEAIDVLLVSVRGLIETPG
jgi:DNA-binding response OmpR family regulator